MIHSQTTHFRLRTSTQPWLRLAALLVAVWSTSVSLAQQSPEMVFESAPGSTPAQASGSASGFPQSHIFGEPNAEDAGVGGFGVLGRVGHIAGNTIERNQSITYFDMSPYLFVEDTYLFGDARLFLTNQGHMGGSAGLGVRQYFPRNDFVLGASAWYDRDDSRTATFQQLGMSFELFSQWMDIRSNYYTGIGTTFQELGTSVAPGTAAFSNHQVTFSTQTDFSASMDTVDLTCTVPVPSEVAQSMNLEASAGWYHLFTPGLPNPAINGFKLRLDADFLDRVLHVYTELSQDTHFDTNLVLAADVNYWHHLESRPRLGASQFNRIAQWVRRNRNIVTLDSTNINPPQAAINPRTGLPYFLNHVRNLPVPTAALPNFPAPTGTGDVLTPYQFIPEAQLPANADLIFVHADSVFDNRPPLVLNDNENIVGEGVVQAIPVLGPAGQIFQLPLPRATTGANRPVIQNTVGTAVTLADNNLFAGFDINDTQGIGILGNTINRGNLAEIRLDGTTGPGSHGIEFRNATGQFQLQNVDISNTEGNAFYVSGGDATIVYNTGTITNSNGISGFSILVENNSGTVNMGGTTTDDTGGDGVRVSGSSGATTLGTLTLTNITGNAIDIQDVTGTVSFFKDITIVDPVGDGIRIENLSGGVSGLKPITINQRNAVGINLLDINSTGAVSFGDTITMGLPDSGGATDHGINFQSSEGIVAFQDVSITGSNAAGINIGDILADPNSGKFIVLGTTSISGAADSSIQVIDDNSEVAFTGIFISNRGDHGIEILNHSGSTNFSGQTIISNGLTSGSSAVDIQDSSGTLRLGSVTATATVGPADPGVRIQNNTGTVEFASLSVQSAGTTALDIQDNSSVSILDGVLEAVGARAVTMMDNATFTVQFDAVSSSASDYGIFVDNDNTLVAGVPLFDHPGSFSVVGDGQTPGSGGTITGATVAGASFFNVNSVNLGFMNILANEIGVESTLVNELTLFGDQVTGNVEFGLDAFNTVDTVIQQSLFDSNSGFNQVRIRAAQQRNSTVTTVGLPGYRVVIRDNTFRDSAVLANVGFGDMISISNLVTANNSTLDLLVENNGRTSPGGAVGFSSNRRFVSGLNPAPDAAISTIWNGNIVANYLNNNIRMSAFSDQIGTRLLTTNSGSLTDVIYSGNVLNDGGGFSETGLLMDFAGSTNLSIIDNFGVDINGNPVVDGFIMNGPGIFVDDRAIDLAFRSTGNIIDISRNQITYNSVDGTAILFQAISGPSSVNMAGNRIVMFDDALFPNELAIVFQNVIGNLNLSSVDLSGLGLDPNNIVLPQTNTTFPLVIPPGVSTGQFLINGFRVP